MRCASATGQNGRVTLILTAITQDQIVQVSDMRLTWPDGSVVDTPAAKMVLWCGRALVAYTGLACIRATRTDVWLAEVLTNATSFKDGVRRIRQRLTAALGNVGGKKHLEVMVASWVKTARDGDWTPIVAEISNVREGDWSVAARSFFQSKEQLVSRVAIGHLGQPLPSQLQHDLDGWLAGSGGGPALMAEALAHAVRALAEENSLVGKALLVGSLPRKAVPVQATLSLGSHDWSQGLFLHIPEGADDPLIYGPNVACRGSVIVDVRAKPGDGDWLPPFSLNAPCS